MARLAEGLAAGLGEGLWSSAFLFRTGQEVSVCFGLVSVEACSLSRTGDSCGTTTFSGVLMGDPSDEDRISSIIGVPVWWCCSSQLLEQPVYVIFWFVGKAVFKGFAGRMERSWTLR